MDDRAPQTRLWQPDFEIDLGLMLVHRHGPRDTSYRISGGPDIQAATHWRATRTPEGIGTLAVSRGAEGVEAHAWGPGADWLLDAVPRLLGAGDNPEGFVTDDALLSPLLRRFGAPRYGRSGRVLEALVPTIFEQKVTTQEAFAGFAALLARWGDPAPGPHPDLRALPSATTLRRIPSWDWLSLPLDPSRSRPLLQALSVADTLERSESGPAELLGQRLRALPGIGEWTEAEVRQRTHGDPDAVSFGDYHLAANVGWALTNESWNDDQLRDYLAGYPGHRRRVVDLIVRAAGTRPRRGARMAPRTHLPTTRRR